MSPWSRFDWRGARLGSEIGFVSLFVGLALALQIKLSGGKPSSAPVLHHRECRFQICKNRDSWVHAHSLRPQLGCNRCIVRSSVAQPRIRSWAPVEALHVPPSRPAREAGRKYSHANRAPNHARIVEIAITLGPLVALWVLAWVGYYLGFWWLSLLIAVPAAGFLVRLFMIQHDCGQGAFFSHRMANDWVGRVIGVLTLTPYDFWRRKDATRARGISTVVAWARLKRSRCANIWRARRGAAFAIGFTDIRSSCSASARRDHLSSNSGCRSECCAAAAGGPG